MPLPSEHKKYFIQLKAAYDSSWVLPWVIPANVANALNGFYFANNDDVKNAWIITKEFLLNSAWRFVSLLFDTTIQEWFTNSPLLIACKAAHKAELLEDTALGLDNFRALLACEAQGDVNFFQISYLIENLQGYGLFKGGNKQRNFNTALQHPNKHQLDNFLFLIAEPDLKLTEGAIEQQNILEMVLHYPDIRILFNTCDFCIRNGVFSPQRALANTKAILEHPNLDVLEMLVLLFRSEEPATGNSTLVELLGEGLAKLTEFKLLPEKHFELLERLNDTTDEIKLSFFCEIIKYGILLSVNLSGLVFTKIDFYENLFSKLTKQGLTTVHLPDLSLMNNDAIVELANVLRTLPKDITTIDLRNCKLDTFSDKKIKLLENALPHIQIVYLSHEERKAMSPEKRLAWTRVFPKLKTVTYFDPLDKALASGIVLLPSLNPTGKVSSLQDYCAFFVAKNIDYSNEILSAPVRDAINTFIL